MSGWAPPPGPIFAPNANSGSGDTTEFVFRVNEGPPQKLVLRTGVYSKAAAAIPAVLGYDLPVNIEIWVERLVPRYGPYNYTVELNQYLNIEVRHRGPTVSTP